LEKLCGPYVHANQSGDFIELINVDQKLLVAKRKAFAERHFDKLL